MNEEQATTKMIEVLTKLGAWFHVKGGGARQPLTEEDMERMLKACKELVTIILEYQE